MNRKEEAIQAVLQGVDPEVMANELGVSTSTIYRWLEEGGHKAQARKIRHREIAEMYNNTDMTVRELCDHFGISTTALYNAVHVTKTPLRKESVDDDDEQTIISMYQAGTKVREIKQVTGRCYETIYSVLEENNIRTRRYSRRRGE